MEKNDFSIRIQEIKDYIIFERETSVIWPWAAPADVILHDDEKLRELADSLVYDPEHGYDTDDIYFSLNQIWGINPILTPKQTNAGPDTQMM